MTTPNSEPNWFFGGDDDWDVPDMSPTGQSCASDDEPDYQTKEEGEDSEDGDN